ncbi:MAG: hypothetical protein JWO94_212 [Verrucomicrobiaceae bacterium]|nr:hypothetical protein [Verrucomicrobiaceae bacterium]
MGFPSLQPKRFATASVGNGCLLDSRRALFHEAQGWLAVADIHFGYELNRARNHGALLPQWGMAATEQRLVEVLEHYQPPTFIIVGDIMDGGGSIRETMLMLGRLRPLVRQLICVEGNHDRAALKRDERFVPWHCGDGFIFQHGHRFTKVLNDTCEHRPAVHITGHEHPALNLSDGAGLRLKLPALVQDRIGGADVEHWILPAFSPWAGGAVYESRHERLAAWACSEGRVLRA